MLKRTTLSGEMSGLVKSRLYTCGEDDGALELLLYPFQLVDDLQLLRNIATSSITSRNAGTAEVSCSRFQPRDFSVESVLMLKGTR